MLYYFNAQPPRLENSVFQVIDENKQINYIGCFARVDTICAI